MKKYNATITQISNLTPTVKLFKFDLRESINFEAGQFVNLSFKKNEKILKKPYSICSNPNNSSKIELCIKLVENGKVTPEIFNLKITDSVEILGPLGLFKISDTPKEKLVFIAAGTGITPFRSMIKNLLLKNEKKEILLFLGVRYETEILFKDEFEKLELNNPQFKFISIVSKASETYLGRQGHVQDNFDLIDPLNSEIYLCGLPLMIDSATKKLEEIGVLKENIHTEKYV